MIEFILEPADLTLALDNIVLETIVLPPPSGPIVAFSSPTPDPKIASMSKPANPASSLFFDPMTSSMLSI